MVVLVVEDHQDVAQVLVRLLQRNGYLAEAVNDGPTALRFLEHIRPEAVLLDVLLPEMDGMEVLRLIRQDALCGDVPVLMFSADGSDHGRQEAMNAGANGYLVRGLVDWYDLRSCLETCARSPQKRRAAAAGA